MNDVVFENLLCDAAAQLREERLEKIKLPHKNQHILRAFAVCVCAAILSLSVVYAVPSMRAQLFSLLQIEEESDWILRFESQTQTEPITTLPEFTPNWLPEDTVRTKFNSSEGPLYDTYSYRQSQYGVTVNSLDIAIFPAQDIQLYLPKEDFPLEMDETTTSIRTYYCALPGFVDSKNEEKTERNAGYLVVSHSGGGMLRQGTRKGIRRTPANRGMRAHRIVKSLDISEDVCHGLCP